MSVTKCLKCDEPVLIPSGVSLKAIVRCPLCHEQFELGEMLDEIPPPLEIIEDPDAIAVSEVAPFSFDLEGKKDDKSTEADSYQVVGDDVEAAGDEAEESVPAFQFDGASKESDGAGAKAYRPTARPQRKGKNPVAEIAKIVGGGVLGIALAIVGIWWGPKIFGFDGKDPFKLGPKVSSVAPWLVPKEFHGGPKNNTDEGKEKGKPKENDARPSGPIDLPNPARNRNNGSDKRTLPTSQFGDAGSSINKQNLRSDEDKPKNNDNKPKKVDKPKVDRAAPEFVGLRDVETSTPEALQKAVRTAFVALTKWEPDDDLDSETFRNDAREAVTALGEHLAFADQTDEDNQPLVGESFKLLEDFRGKPKKIQILNSWAADRLKQPQEEPIGILLAGEVKTIENRGPLFESQLKLLTDEGETIAVLTKDDPTAWSPPGAKVIVIGVLVRDPQENFAGYAGTDPQVVGCGALALLEPVPANPGSK